MLKMMYWIIYNDKQFNNCTRLDDKGSAPDFPDVSRTVTNFFLYQEKKRLAILKLGVNMCLNFIFIHSSYAWFKIVSKPFEWGLRHHFQITFGYLILKSRSYLIFRKSDERHPRCSQRWESSFWRFSKHCLVRIRFCYFTSSFLTLIDNLR